MTSLKSNMKKILNKLGLYTKSDMKQAFKNGAISEQNKMYVFSQDDFKFQTFPKDFGVSTQRGGKSKQHDTKTSLKSK